MINPLHATLARQGRTEGARLRDGLFSPLATYSTRGLQERRLQLHRVWIGAPSVHVQVMGRNQFAAVIMLHLFNHLLLASGIEATGSLGLVASGIAAMGEHK